MGATEIVFIFIIYLLLFGAKGIPSLAQTMGKTIRQFKDATQDIQNEIMDSANDIRSEVEGTIKNADPTKKKPSPKKDTKPES